MDWQNVLSIVANVAQIVTAIVAAFFGGRVLWRAHRRRCALEEYLKAERKREEGPSGEGHGLRTILHLMSQLAMTEAQVLEAAFASHIVKRWTAVDEETGRADALFLQYDKRGGSN
jgi:hypothetical protein